MSPLNANHHPKRDHYIHDLRIKLTREFPGVMFLLSPADIVSQI